MCANNKLNKTNIQLSEKVNMGSTLKIKDITVEPFRYRSTGKEVSAKIILILLRHAKINKTYSFFSQPALRQLFHVGITKVASSFF